LLTTALVQAQTNIISIGHHKVHHMANEKQLIVFASNENT
jgi:sorbitol-specific phosphotransferase system component IIA